MMNEMITNELSMQLKKMGIKRTRLQESKQKLSFLDVRIDDLTPLMLLGDWFLSSNDGKSSNVIFKKRGSTGGEWRSKVEMGE